MPSPGLSLLSDDGTLGFAARGSPRRKARLVHARRSVLLAPHPMTPTPLSLNARDFDAYAPEKATSNAYSRPRLEVKQRALAWARGVVARLGELGMPVDVHGSDEHPTLRNKKRVDRQWVFFSRDAEAREGLDRLLDRGRSIADDSCAVDDVTRCGTRRRAAISTVDAT